MLIAGCGHSSQHAHAPAPRPQAPAPFGHLSPAEYAAIVREYTLMEPLRKSSAGTGTARKARAACGRVPNPNTQLMTLVRQDCLNALRFFTAFNTLTADPTQPTSYSTLAATMRDIVANAEQINAELDRRQIGGVCADSIGITNRDAHAMDAAAIAASEAAAAAASGATRAFLLAQHQLTQALGSQSTTDPLVGIKRDCRTSQPAPPKAGRGSRTKPSPAPRIPAPGEGIKA